MAWCHKAPNLYLNQFWSRSLSQYGVTRTQFVNPRVVFSIRIRSSTSSFINISHFITTSWSCAPYHSRSDFKDADNLGWYRACAGFIVCDIGFHLGWEDCSAYLYVKHLVNNMMTPSNGNIFRIIGPLCGEFTGHQWIPHTKASDAELWCFLWSAPE